MPTDLDEMTCGSVRSYADYTNYKKLYSEVYWGDFHIHEGRDTVRLEEMKDIFKNRNEFITKYNIKSILPKKCYDNIFKNY